MTASVTSVRIAAITDLLVQTGQAHGRFEEKELLGAYDQQWPHWYAAYAVKHGLDRLLGHKMTAERLAEFLAASNTDYERTAKSLGTAWAAYTARRMSEEL
jgi:hypothetical protein